MKKGSHGGWMLGIGLGLFLSSGLRAEWVHPNMMLNQAEIEEIKARVKSGKEPWKAAYAKLIRNAEEGVKRRPASLKYSREEIKAKGCESRCTSNFTAPYKISHNEPRDRHQCTDAGYYLIHMALAWHLTGQEKYAEGARKQIDVWFFQPDTRMDTKYPGGDDVAGTNSFAAIVWGIDLSWPFLPAETRTKLKEWHKAYLESLGSPQTCSQNRCAWKATAAMMCAIIAEDAQAMANSMNVFKTYNMDKDNMPGRVADEDKGDKRYMYRMFTVNALMQIAEIARHYGVDLYNYGVKDGKWKIERSWDYYGQFTRHPERWEKLERVPVRTDRVYTGSDKVTFEVAQAIRPKAEYAYILSRYQPGRPMLDRGTDQSHRSSLHAVTLTHSAGTFTYKVYDKNGTPLSLIGGSATTALLGDSPAGDSQPRWKSEGRYLYELDGSQVKKDMRRLYPGVPLLPGRVPPQGSR